MSNTSDGARTLPEAEHEIILMAERIEGLMREKEALVRTLDGVTRTATLLQQNSVGCAQQHHGMDTELNGLPGWLRDTAASIDEAQATLAALKKPAATGDEGEQQ
jgi:hypothetical protein